MYFLSLLFFPLIFLFARLTQILQFFYDWTKAKIRGLQLLCHRSQGEDREPRDQDILREILVLSTADECTPLSSKNSQTLSFKNA